MPSESESREGRAPRTIAQNPGRAVVRLPALPARPIASCCPRLPAAPANAGIGAELDIAAEPAFVLPATVVLEEKPDPPLSQRIRGR